MVLVWSRLALALAAALLFSVPPAHAGCKAGNLLAGLARSSLEGAARLGVQAGIDYAKKQAEARNNNYPASKQPASPSTTPKLEATTDPHPLVPVSTRITAEKTKIPMGGVLIIQCEVDGYPVPDVYWTKDGTKLSNSSQLQVTESRLTFLVSTAADSGEYGCYAANPNGAHSSAVQITVQCQGLSGLNTWCCYSYYEDANGWLRFYSKPANSTTANSVCKRNGGELASVFKIGTVMLNAVPRLHPVSVHGGLEPIWEQDSNFDFKLRHEIKILHYNSSMETIDEEEKYPFICTRQNEMINYTKCGVANNGYELYNGTGHCYKFIRKPATWLAAREMCCVHGADLVVINNEREAQIVREIFQRNPENTISGQTQKNAAFIGIFRNQKHKEQWMTVHGYTLKESGYDRFATGGEPNNARGDEECGTVQRSGLLQDDACDVTQPYICERQTGLPLCPFTTKDERCDEYPY